MFKLYDFSCLNEECDNYQKIMEILVSDDEKPVCEGCKQIMEVSLTYGQGLVRSGTPKFHRNSKSKTFPYVYRSERS